MILTKLTMQQAVQCFGRSHLHLYHPRSNHTLSTARVTTLTLANNYILINTTSFKDRSPIGICIIIAGMHTFIDSDFRKQLL
jgi:hypothetical protein